VSACRRNSVLTGETACWHTSASVREFFYVVGATSPPSPTLMARERCSPGTQMAGARLERRGTQPQRATELIDADASPTPCGIGASTTYPTLTRLQPAVNHCDASTAMATAIWPATARGQDPPLPMVATTPRGRNASSWHIGCRAAPARLWVPRPAGQLREATHHCQHAQLWRSAIRCRLAIQTSASG
jgi:hypothetical protein